MVRRVQEARRDSGLEVSDRIDLQLWLPAELATAVESNSDYLAEQTLSESVSILPTSPDGGYPPEARRYELPGAHGIAVRVVPR